MGTTFSVWQHYLYYVSIKSEKGEGKKIYHDLPKLIIITVLTNQETVPN